MYLEITSDTHLVVACNILEPYRAASTQLSLTFPLFPDIWQAYTSPHLLSYPFSSDCRDINCSHHHTSPNLTICSKTAFLSHKTFFVTFLFPSKWHNSFVAMRFPYFLVQALITHAAVLWDATPWGFIRNRFLKFVWDSVFERMSVFQWFALMQIREDWGDSLVLSCVPLPAVQLCRGGVQIQKPLYLAHCPLMLSSDEGGSGAARMIEWHKMYQQTVVDWDWYNWV